MRLVILSVTMLALGACGDPMAKLPRLADVEMAEDAGQAAALSDPTEDNLSEAEPVAIASDQDKPRGGLLGFLRKKADSGKAEGDAAVEGDALAESAASDDQTAPEQSATEEVQLAALAPQPEAEPRKKGLFGGLLGGGATDGGSSAANGPKPGAPDYEKVGPGVTLPHGKVARLCGVSAASLGKKAESFPGRSGPFTLYDSAPGSTAPRNFYMTGFDDGCARQFTAALVMFASVETYDQIHYGMPGATLTRSETDRAYESLKSRVCRVAKGKPCGGRSNRLARNTAFVSIYERFEDNARWTTLLVHDGEVLAIDTKG